MAFNADLSALTFDSFSTVVDVEATAEALETYVDDAERFAREWHMRAANYGMLGNHLDRFATYEELHRHALAYLFETRGIDADAAVIDEINAIYHELPPFPDIRPGFEALDDAGYDLGIISNGNPALLDSMVNNAEIGDLVDVVVSANEIERHKPASELYEHAAERIGHEPGDIAHVSNVVFDVQGAMHAGMTGIWLNRENAPDEPFGPSPDLTIRNLDELLAEL